MSVLSEKAEKGNAKALESIYLNGRGLVRWIWSMLSGSEIPQSEEREVWKTFFDAVSDGALLAGDQIETILAAAAATVYAGSGSKISKRSKKDTSLSLIKFPGDMDAGKKYLEKLISVLEPGARASAMISACGFSAEETGALLGKTAEEVNESLLSSVASLKDAAREFAGGKYNINIPSIEMFADILGRTSIASDVDPDTEILDYAGQVAAIKSTVQRNGETEKTGRRKKPFLIAVAACCILAIGLSLYFIFGKDKPPVDPSGGTGTYDGPVNNDPETDDDVYANYRVVMEIRDYGTIEIELDSSAAPRTVKNFVDLVKRKFYDGLTFHRIMDGFMIQGGDPEGNGSGGSDKKIIGEFKDNGVDNPISHTRGTISMARANGDYNSARSQFFIVQQDSLYLDGQYAAFGHVVSGMDVVDRIAADAEPIDNNGTIPPDKQPVIESVTVSVI